MRSLVIIIFVFFGTLSITGQTTLLPKQVDYNYKGIVYNDELAFEFKIHSNGFALGTSIGKIKTYYRTTYYTFELGYLKDSRERRQNKNLTFTFAGGSSSFVYGKQNSLYIIRGGVGEKRYLSEKARRKGLAVGINYEGGLTLGMLKPYYLEMIHTSENDFATDIRTIKYSDENHEDFLDYEDIFGGANYFKGITETSFVVGAHGKLGLMLAFGAFDKYVKSLETGIMLDVYPAKVPLLVERGDLNNHRMFLNLYIAFQIGSRR